MPLGPTGTLDGGFADHSLRLYHPDALSLSLSLSLLCKPWALELPHDFHFTVRAHVNALNAISSTPLLTFQEAIVSLSIKALHIYTDGTHVDRLHNPRGHAPAVLDQLYSIWSFVVLAEDIEGGFHLLGQAAGPVSADSSSPTWLGAQTCDSMAAEMTALVWAMFWLLSKAHDLGCALHGSYAVPFVMLHFDCMAAGGAMAWAWRVPCHPISTRILIGLFRVVCVYYLAFGQHVKGHDGHPWNEAADAVGRQFREHHLQQFTTWEAVEDKALLHEGLQQLLVAEDGLWTEWLFVAALPPPMRRQYAVSAAGLITPEVRAAPVCELVTAAAIAESIDQYQEPGKPCAQTPGPSLEAETLEPTAPSRTSFRVVSISAQTLKAKRKRRVHAFQLAKRRTHVVCVQEGRAKFQQHFQVGDFHVWTAGATAEGHHGVEVWFNTRIPFSVSGPAHTGKKLGVDDVNIIFADPRVLLAEVSSSVVDVIVVAAHAPGFWTLHPDPPHEPVAIRWWRHLAELLLPYRQRPMIMGVDANLDFFRTPTTGNKLLCFEEFQRVLSKLGLGLTAIAPGVSAYPAGPPPTFGQPGRESPHRLHRIL